MKFEEAIEAALRGIREFGHQGKIALEADGENAVKALKGEVLRRLDGGGFSIQPTAHEHESNGGVENEVKISKDFSCAPSCTGAQDRRPHPH